MPITSLLKIPDGLSDRHAAAMMLKGMTACYLIRHTFRVKPGMTVLVHAAAGRVGLILCQWPHHLQATVIGTVDSDEKAALTRAHGYDHQTVYTRQGFVQTVRALTGGNGVDIIYDGVGRDAFADSLDFLRPRGMMVAYGNALWSCPSG
ncbi:MAG: NADPH2:quinone reductase [Rhodospirillaceae bacterium]|nr:MAG: NADPH2:quinone reductase [Rhodospirillaceae bacterium]